MRYMECFVLTSALKTWLFSDHNDVRTRPSLFSIFIISLDEINIITLAGHFSALMMSVRGRDISLTLRAPGLCSMTEHLNGTMTGGIFYFSWGSA